MQTLRQSRRSIWTTGDHDVRLEMGASKWRYFDQSHRWVQDLPVSIELTHETGSQRRVQLPRYFPVGDDRPRHFRCRCCGEKAEVQSSARTRSRGKLVASQSREANGQDPPGRGRPDRKNTLREASREAESRPPQEGAREQYPEFVLL